MQAKRPWSPIEAEQVEDLIFYGALGVILGGRFGYVFFYQFSRFLEDPLWLVRVWEGGMSFHGGLLGVIIALVVYSRKHQLELLQLGDFVAPLAPIGLFLGRIGNFVGQELWGRSTDGWWAMVFPNDPLQLPRHPSQLYEALLEGLVIFIALNWLARRPRQAGLLSGLFLVMYACFRFLVEFVREPDSHLQELLFGWVTRGQLLCIPMLLAGLALIYMAQKSKPKMKSNGATT